MLVMPLLSSWVDAVGRIPVRSTETWLEHSSRESVPSVKQAGGTPNESQSIVGCILVA